MSTQVPAPKSFVTGTLTDVGKVRTVNQDYCDEFFDEATGRRLLVLADGMGGHRGGEVASRMAVEEVGEVFAGGGPEAGDLLHEALESANTVVHQRAAADPELAGMGTTAVCLLFERGAQTWVAHVGDSRAYRLRGGKFERLTEDHSVVGALIRGNHITEEEARRHPQRNEILRAIGTNAQVEVQIAGFSVEPADCYVLCSDGLSGMVSDDEIAQVIATEEPDEAVRVLVEMANLEGGTDNITVQIVTIPSDAVEGKTAPPPAASTEAWDGETTERIYSPEDRSDGPTSLLFPASRLWLFAAGAAVILLGWLIFRG